MTERAPPPPEDPTGLRRAPKIRRALGEPAPPARSRPLRVGLLGGSFNPAHDGHRYISMQALKRLGLDQVWWLVSPQNPLKPRAGMAPLEERLNRARAVADYPRIKVTALEQTLATRYTADTLARLARWRGHRFVWLIGADNLEQMPRWHRWTHIFQRCPVAVFERLPYSYGALAGRAATRFADARMRDDRARELAGRAPPSWTFLRLKPHPESATAIRMRTAFELR